MPASASDVSEDLIERCIIKGVADVFKTMSGESVQSLGRTPNPPLHSRPMNIEGPHIVASVGFIGDLNGLIHTHFDDQLAVEISSQMLGMPIAEIVPEVLADATGELTNMIVGVFKNTLCDMGYNCKLTLPSIVRGSDLHVDHALKSARRFIFNFRCRSRAVVTDIILQQD